MRWILWDPPPPITSVAASAMPGSGWCGCAPTWCRTQGRSASRSRRLLPDVATATDARTAWSQRSSLGSGFYTCPSPWLWGCRSRAAFWTAGWRTGGRGPPESPGRSGRSRNPAGTPRRPGTAPGRSWPCRTADQAPLRAQFRPGSWALARTWLCCASGPVVDSAAPVCERTNHLPSRAR